MNSIKIKYKKEIAPALQKEFNLSSVMEIPRLEKIIINSGVGEAAQDAKNIELASKELELISGQKPLITKSKKSIATYKLRQGQAIGVKVTLRDEKMWNFVDLLFNIALPRVRDFRGIPVTSFDGRGNYTMGIKEQIIFPQINYDDIKSIRGFDVTFVTSTNDDLQAESLLRKLGAPFKKRKES